MDIRERLLSGLPVTERRLPLAGVSTYMWEGGDGPPIVLLQGEFAAVWMRVIPDLVTTHRIIAADLPGLGASEGSGDVLRWLDALVEQTCAEPPVLVGKGLGGALAARYAVAHSDRIAHLVLVDAQGLERFRPPAGMALTFVSVMLRPTERGLERSFRRYCFVDLDRVRARDGRGLRRARGVRPGPVPHAERQVRDAQPLRSSSRRRSRRPIWTGSPSRRR